MMRGIYRLWYHIQHDVIYCFQFIKIILLRKCGRTKNVGNNSLEIFEESINQSINQSISYKLLQECHCVHSVRIAFLNLIIMCAPKVRSEQALLKSWNSIGSIILATSFLAWYL